MIPVSPISGDDLASMVEQVRKAIAKAHMEELPERWVRWLAEGIVGEKSRLLALASTQDAHSDQRRAAGAVKTLTDVIPRLRGGDGDEALARLQNALFLAAEFFDSPAPSPRSADWHDSASFLAEGLLFAFESACRGKTLGVSADGPAVGYVEAMLPVLIRSGRPVPTREAIRKQLNRRTAAAKLPSSGNTSLTQDK